MKHKDPFMALLIAIAIFASGCSEPTANTENIENTVPADTQRAAITAEQPEPPDKKLLVGDWTRTDAEYQLKIA